MVPMSGRKRVAVVIPTIDAGVEWANILAARDRYDPLASLVPPHLTLVSPFEDPISDSALHAHVSGAVSGLARFDAVLCGITAHENEYLFLNVKCGNDHFIQLRDVLYAGPLAAHLLRTYTFVPHLTVGRVRSGDLSAALAHTSSLTRPVRARIDAVSVYRIDPDGERPILFKVPLRAQAAV